MIEIATISLIVLMIIGALVAIETTNLLYSVISVGAVGFLLSIVFVFLSAPDLAITQIAVEVITLVLLLRATQGSPQDDESQDDSPSSLREGRTLAPGETDSRPVFTLPHARGSGAVARGGDCAVPSPTPRGRLSQRESEVGESAAGTRIKAGNVAAMVMVILLGIFSVSMFAEFPAFGSPVIDRFADAPSNTYLRDGLERTGAANIVTAVLLDFRAYDTLGEATVLFCAVMGAISVLRPKAKKHLEEADEEVES